MAQSKQLLAVKAQDDDAFSDVVMDASAMTSRQTSVRPSVQSEDEIEPNEPEQQSASEAEEEEDEEEEDEEDEIEDDDGDVDMQPGSSKADARREKAKVDRARKSKENKDKKKAVSGRLHARQAGMKSKKVVDSIKRFSYLLGQTDLFSHFCDLKKQRDPEFAKMLEEAESNVAGKKAKATRGNAEGARRRKTEREEDAELLKGGANDNEGEDDALYVFSESPPFVKGGEMRDYQVQGLNWMIGLNHNGINGILADEMGLGKTLQTIAFLGYLKHIRGIKGPHLVVVPKSTLDNWSREVNHWVPGFNVCMLRGTKEERAVIVNERILTQDFEICIASYEICQREKASLKKIAWEYIVIDEAHRIKNVNSLLSQIVRLFDSRHRLLITGTPLQNNLQELWSLLNFLLPDVFSNSEDFDKWFESNKTGEGDNGDQVVQQLHKVLRPFLLRRVKAEVEHSLLPKKEVNIYVGMTDMQRKWYRSILEKDLDAVTGTGPKKEGKARLQNIVMQLRKCCNHPYLFDGAEPGPPYTTDVHLIDNAGKMVVLDKLLKSLKAKGSRVLIFSQMSRVLDILEDYCFFRQYEYCRLDGQTEHEDRMAAIDAYNKEGSSKFLFLLTTRAGGLGINLTSADVVILFDSDWNPQADLQAMDRAHRIGQKKQVYVFRFVTENAVEEKVLERAAQKLRLDQLVIQQGRTAPKKDASSKDEILDMIQHGAERIVNNKDSMLIDDDIDDIIKRGEDRTAKLQAKTSELTIHDLTSFSVEAGTTKEWNGESFGGKPKINLTFEPVKRERKGNNYSVDGYYRDHMKTGERRTAAPRAPKPPNVVQRSDHQFFPRRFMDLQEQENAHYQKTQGYFVPLREDKTATQEDLENEQKAAQAFIDNAEPLTEADLAEKESLSTDGFDGWHKRHFQNFIRGSEVHGKDNFEGIHRELTDKTVEEIQAYHKVFWQRYEDLEGWERYIQKIDEAEKGREKDSFVTELLKNKVADTRHPYQQLSIVYANQTKGKSYSEEEDRFLLVQLSKHGLLTEGVYDMIKKDVCNWPAFRFDWFVKSRTPTELQRRCATLIQLVQKEHDDAQIKAGRMKPAPKLNGDSSSSAPVKKGSRKRKSTVMDDNDSIDSGSRAGTPVAPTKSKRARRG